MNVMLIVNSINFQAQQGNGISWTDLYLGVDIDKESFALAVLYHERSPLF